MAVSETSPEPNEVAALIPAAGQGRRIGGTPKQFRTLGERSVLAQVRLLFERHPTVGHAIVAVPSDQVQAVSERLQTEGLSSLTGVVSGENSRQSSVCHALRAVLDSVTTVLVHDAAAPSSRPPQSRRSCGLFRPRAPHRWPCR